MSKDNDKIPSQYASYSEICDEDNETLDKTGLAAVVEHG